MARLGYQSHQLGSRWDGPRSPSLSIGGTMLRGFPRAAAGVAVLAALAVALLAAAATGGARISAAPTFTNFVISSTPPHAAGTTCPGVARDCWNGAAEP